MSTTTSQGRPFTETELQQTTDAMIAEHGEAVADDGFVLLSLPSEEELEDVTLRVLVRVACFQARR